VVSRCSTGGLDEKCIQNFGREIERKTLLLRTRRRWEDDIRMDLTEIGCKGVDWTHLIQDRDQ